MAEKTIFLRNTQKLYEKKMRKSPKTKLKKIWKNGQKLNEEKNGRKTK